MIYITLDNFFIKVHEAIKPILRQVPFAIAEHGYIIAANDVAIHRGLTLGISTLKARKKIYNLTIEQKKDNAISEFSKQFFSILYKSQFSIIPDTAWSAYLKTKSFGQKERLMCVEQLKKEIFQDLEIPTKIGVANSRIASKLAALITSPDEILSIEKEKESDFMQALPISLLPGIGKRTGALLAGFGITTIGAFSELPQAEVTRLFGKSGAYLHRIANGKEEYSASIVENKKICTKSYELPFPSRNLPHILSLASFLSYQLTSTMKTSDKQGKSCVVTIYQAQGAAIKKQKKLKNGVEDLTLESSSLIKKILSEQKLLVRKITIAVKTLPQNSRRYHECSKADYAHRRVSQEKESKFNGFTLPLFSFGGNV